MLLSLFCMALHQRKLLDVSYLFYLKMLTGMLARTSLEKKVRLCSRLGSQKEGRG